MKRMIKEIHYDYVPPRQEPGGFYEEEIQKVRVDENGVFSIVEHTPKKEFEHPYFEIHYENGHIVRTYRVSKVIYQILDDYEVEEE